MKQQDVFSANHFCPYGHFIAGEDAARISNERINELLGPEVRCDEDRMWVESDTVTSDLDTHTARLFNIQPIEKKKCDGHVPEFDGPGNWVCYKCKVKIVPATWTEAGE